MTTALPSRATADVIAFGRDGSARTSGWTFHGERPSWAGLGKDTVDASTSDIGHITSSTPRREILSLVRDTAARHAQNRALTGVGLDARDWQVLFRSLVEAESSYNPEAVSPKGAYGLGQLMPDTARSLGVDPRNINQNLDGAARYLLAQLAAFQDIDLALAAYNAGPHRVTEYSGVPPFAETRTYISRVHQIRSRLAGTPISQPDPRVAATAPQRAPVLIDLN